MTYIEEELAEHKAEWVAALRSGEYEQCTNVLHNGVGYCCLGVLGVLAGDQVMKGDGAGEYYVGGMLALPSYEAMKYVGFPSSEDCLLPCSVELPNGDKVELPDLNDSGMPFSQIADVIEKGEIV